MALAILLAAAACLAPVAALFPGGGRAAASAEPRPRKVILVVIDRIGLEDLTPENAPNILELAGRGQVALMNARVRRDQYGAGGYMAIGAGGRAFGGPNSPLAFNESELLLSPGGHEIEAGALYRQRTGRDAPAGSVLNPYIEEMKRRSDVPQASSLPGLLGLAAREAGLRVAVLGNADSLAPAGQVLPGAQPQFFLPALAPAGGALDAGALEAGVLHREAALIAMDDAGIVPAGDAGSRMYRPSRSAAGVTTDFDTLIESARRELERSDILVLDMGQTARVDEQAPFYSDRALELARGRALKMSDAALAGLLEHVDLERDVIAVCVPTPTRKMILNGDLLTPVVFAGAGFTPGQRLSSPTTRRSGLVSNFDMAPTALDILGVEPPAEMDGRPVEAPTGGPAAPLPAGAEQSSARAAEELESLRDFERRATGASVSRRGMVRLYAVAGIALVLLFLLVSLIRPGWIGGRRFSWSLALMSLLAGPLAFLVVPALGVPALYWVMPASVAASVLLALAALLLGRREACPLRPLMALSGLTALVILVDVSLGSRLMTFSPFGSDVMMADRYYGIGNLYMGFAIGSAVLFGCLAASALRSLDSPARRLAFCGAVFGATAFVIGFGRLGANFGGLVAALVGGIAALIKLEGGRLKAGRVLVGVVILVALVALMLAADMLLPGNASHAGRALARAESGAGSSLLAQAGRKLAANWALTWSSIWRLLLLALLVTGLGLNWRYRLFARLRADLPAVYAAFVGLGFALPAALLLNDSGIEAAVAISVFLFVPFLVMLVRRVRDDAPLPTGAEIGSRGAADGPGAAAG